MIIKINGDIIGNNWKDVYNWFGIESTCPNDVISQLEALPEGEKAEIKINSGGGDVYAGQEIYTILRARDDVEIEIESIAASAASIIAMAGRCTISPIGMIMIHTVSTGAHGNHRDMEKTADILRQWDSALASAYVEKTGKPKDEIIRLMEKETWLPADKALENGFVDAISEPAQKLTNAFGGMQVTDEMLEQYKSAMKKKADQEDLDARKNKLLNNLRFYGV